MVVVFSWEDIEPTPGYFYWEQADAAVRAAAYYGIDIVARLDRAPDWALDASTPTPWNPDAYAGFTRRVAERYTDQLAAVILWNEPNLALEWNGEIPDAAAFVSLLAAGHDAIRSVDKDLPILLGGPAMTLGDGVTAVDDLRYLDDLYAAGGGAFFDGVALHPYGFGRPPQEPPAPDRLNFRRIELQLAVLERYGDGDKPLWITEAGWRTAAPDPRDGWQVVTPAQQTAYALAAVEWAWQSWPTLRGFAFWELNAEGDSYGYDLWHGDNDRSDLYDVLVETCPSRRSDCTAPAGLAVAESTDVSVLATDVAVRLGDRGELHPHWVHLYNSGRDVSRTWTGEFFVSAAQAQTALTLVLETMQVDQPTTAIYINGAWIGNLRPRSTLDATSTWVSQHFALPAGVVQAGVNRITVDVGLRTSTRQYGWWRYENFQFRNLRLIPAQAQTPTTTWAARPSPGGWSVITRLRKDDDNLWAVANRAGQLWHLPAGADEARNLAADRPDLVVVDVAPAPEGLLVAATSGLFLRGDDASWRQIEIAAAGIPQFVAPALGGFVAGFEDDGLWRAPNATGPWRRFGLPDQTLFDLVEYGSALSRVLYVAGDGGIFVWRTARPTWRQLPAFPPNAPGRQGQPAEAFTPRLYPMPNGDLLARNQDRLWQWTGESWRAYGPDAMQGRLVAAHDGLVGTAEAGVWQLDGDEWRLLADEWLAQVEVMDLAAWGNGWVAGTSAGLLSSVDGTHWRTIGGLPPVTTDLIIDPAQPARWLAATPAGVWRSDDSGASWTAISPPWVVNDLAFDGDGRLYAATIFGIQWTDDVTVGAPLWQTGAGMDRVFFFGVAPAPGEAGDVWAGSWGNNVGRSDDRGATFAPIHNGLETLSVLDVLWHNTPGQATIATIEGLYRTDDGGASWFKLPGPLMGQTVHALMQGVDGVIWAGAADGLWRSDDYGVTWQRATGVGAHTVISLGNVEFEGASILWVGTEYSGLWISQDNGVNWTWAGPAERSVYGVIAAENLSVATDQGILSLQSFPVTAP